MVGKIYAISGIDTDIGKTVATGLLAKKIMDKGHKVITQKLIQTGCKGISEDIILHREIMGIEPIKEDIDGVTCPYVFSTPCSPHLAATIEKRTISKEKIVAASNRLAKQYEIILLEGAGGLQVPITLDYTWLDYIEEQKLPLILVTTPRLGSINHTLNAFEIAANRDIEIVAVLYNLFGINEESTNNNPIVNDSRMVIEHYLKRYGWKTKIFDFDDWRYDEKSSVMSKSGDLYATLIN